jgi:hypothetical protein
MPAPKLKPEVQHTPLPEDDTVFALISTREVLTHMIRTIDAALARAKKKR